MATDCPVCEELGIEPDHAPYADPRLGDGQHGQYDPEHPEDVRIDGGAQHDPRVRTLGQVEDIDGMAIELGVDYDTVVVGGKRLTRAAAEEFGQLFVAACWEAADCGGRMAAENSDGDDGPVFITMNADPPKPPYGTPERAVWDAGHG